MFDALVDQGPQAFEKLDPGVAQMARGLLGAALEHFAQLGPHAADADRAQNRQDVRADLLPVSPDFLLDVDLLDIEAGRDLVRARGPAEEQFG